MAISFFPKPGTVVMCDFQRGVVPPEIDKNRPVVIVSPWQRKNTGLATVVPLSTTEPHVIRDYHVELTNNPHPLNTCTVWAKCDLVSCVSHGRLDRFMIGKKGGNRQYATGQVTNEELEEIRKAIKFAIGLS